MNVVLDAIDTELQKRIENSFKETDKKRETEIVKLLHSYLGFIIIGDFENYTEKYFCDLLEKLHNRVDKIGKETLVGLFL